MSTTTGKSLGQQGMVSFTVTLVMMAVITLIVIGFSQVVRRNAREALDRQLSSQAFYAAESGINVTQTKLVAYVNASGVTNLAAKSTCKDGYQPDATLSPTGDDGNAAAGDLSPTGGVRFTCVLVDPTPQDLQFPAYTAQSVIMPLKTNGVPLSNLDFQWSYKPKGSKMTCANGDFSSPTAWDASCDYGVLRVDLVQISNPAMIITSPDQLANQTVTLFLTPRSGHPSAQTLSFGTPTTGYLLSGTGCASGYCKTSLSLPSISSYYLVRVTMLYEDSSNVIITGNNKSAKFIGSQAVIDVTGQAQDELRRIQERIKLNSSTDTSTLPMDALSSSTDICKHFSILPKVVNDPSDNIVDLTNTCQ